jgi:hypothetical protein
MLTGSSNEHGSKLLRVGNLLHGEFKTSAKPLPAGDYMFEARSKLVGIEVKWSIGDLLSSLQVQGENGGPRLAVEVRKLLALVDIPILIVPSIRTRGDGFVLADYGERDKTGWQYSSVMGILTDIQLYGCILDQYDGDIAVRLAQWYYSLRAPQHDWIRQMGRPEFMSLDTQYTSAVWALCAFPGIGPVAAEALLLEFGSIDVITQQSVGSIIKVKGVGPKTATSLWEGLHGAKCGG